MTFPKGQWTTEYAVEYKHPDEKSWGIDDLGTSLENAGQRAAWWRGHGYDVKTMTRQVFHGEWQPLPERTNT